MTLTIVVFLYFIGWNIFFDFVFYLNYSREHEVSMNFDGGGKIRFLFV